MTYRDAAKAAGLPPERTVVSGCLGPKGDAYQTNDTLTAEGSEAHHAEQIATLKDAGANVITALTLKAVDEATGNRGGGCRHGGCPCL